MATVVVVDSSLQADSQPKSGGLVWGSAAAWRCSTFVTWTEWTLAMTLWSWCHDYSTIIYIISSWYYYYYYYYYYSHLKASFQAVPEKTVKNFRGLLFRKIGDFRPKSPFISEMVRDRPMVTMER